MDYLLIAAISFLTGAVIMFVYHKKVIAQIDRAKGQVKDAAGKI